MYWDLRPDFKRLWDEFTSALPNDDLDDRYMTTQVMAETVQDLFFEWFDERYDPSPAKSIIDLAMSKYGLSRLDATELVDDINKTLSGV